MSEQRRERPRGSRSLVVSAIPFVVSIAVLAAVVVFSALHVGEARRFAGLLERAQPIWVLVGLALQAGTYLCAAAIWARVAVTAGHRLSKPDLVRLAVEKLTVDQLVPAAGMAGNVVVVSAMRRMGLPATVATEALLVEILSSYFALALSGAVALVVLAVHHDVTPAIVAVLGVFSVLVIAVPLAIAWLLRHRSRPLPRRLARVRAIARTRDALEGISSERVWDVRLLSTASAVQLGIILLDAATLWAMVRALGIALDPLTALVALVMATVAGTLSLLPGGVGSFEAVSTATLALLGAPVEAALTGTLLLRGLTLWLPLVPGALLARRDLASRAVAHPGDDSSAMAASALASLSVLLEQLSSVRSGLGEPDAALRLSREGANAIESAHGGTLARELARALASPVAVILLIAAVASAFLGELANALIIGAMVLLSAGVNVWQSSRSARALQSLEAHVSPTAIVLRDGEWKTLPRRVVVRGDVVQLAAGDLVPADARLIESTDLHVQQSALTGESLPAQKVATEGTLSGGGPDAPALVFAGTSIVSGTATAVVLATGARTAFGDVVARLSARPEETEFERGARRFGMLILQTVTFLVLFILVVSLATGRDAFSSLLFAVALAVGLTPEYLPMITSVTLAQGALQMAREKVVVKHLASIQNLGSIDVLCSDKTGTLTSGEVSLDASIDPLGRPSPRPLELAQINSALETGVKSPLDAAILAQPRGGMEGYRKVAEIPFDFERRRLSVVVERGLERLLVTKGAPEGVLSCCSRLEVDGATRALDDDARRACLDLFERLSAEGYRTLAVAHRSVDVRGSEREHGERDMVFCGYLTFADQMLPGVAEAIAGLRSDGVAVKILSGDNELVTRTLCRKAGLEAEPVVTGDRVARLDEVGLGALAERASVFARVSPAQKHRIVMALKHRGHVVGFLGDGINDAPSLHGADVGISVAGAVDVAREASDIILLERRLDVLHAGIVAGRRSFANVLKYLLMGTSSNFGNVLSMAAAVFFLPFLPMLPTQILVNNFLYDLAQVSIPTDHVDPAYVRGPQRWDIGVVRRFMLVVGPISSAFDLVTFAVLLLGFRFGESLFQTAWFVESLCTQVLVLLVIRTAGRAWKNRPSTALAIAVVVVVVVGSALPYSPLAAPLGMTPLPPSVFVLLVIVVPMYLIVVELVKGSVMRGVVRAADGTTRPPSADGAGALLERPLAARDATT